MGNTHNAKTRNLGNGPRYLVLAYVAGRIRGFRFCDLVVAEAYAAGIGGWVVPDDGRTL